jgi:hypothetical protein
VAAKHALCFHLCISDPQSPVSAQVMKDAIAMAETPVTNTFPLPSTATAVDSHE